MLPATGWHLINEVTGPEAFEGLRQAGRAVRQPGRTIAVADHNVPTENRAAGAIGADGAAGHVIEYMGPAVEALDMAGRMTLCNLSIEFDARAGMVAPDQVTFARIKGRELAPGEAIWEASVNDWRALRTDDGATFDRMVTIDGANGVPMVTWGTNPDTVLSVVGLVPDPQGYRSAAAPCGSRGHASLDQPVTRRANRGNSDQ